MFALQTCPYYCRRQEEPGILIFRSLLRMRSTYTVCSQPALIQTSIENDWNSTLIMRVLTTYHVKLTQSTALGQKRLDLRLLSPAFCNIRLLLVMCRNFLLFYYICYVFLGPCYQKRCWSFSYKETHHSRQRKISIWKRRYSKAFLFCSVKV